jgi:hypothetical protein
VTLSPFLLFIKFCTEVHNVLFVLCVASHQSGITASLLGFAAHQLSAGHAAGDALALAGVKLGLVVRLINLPPVILRGMHRLAVGRPAGDALALAGGKIGPVDKPMLTKRSSLESGLDFMGAVFSMGFLLPRLVILLIGLLFPPREFLLNACSVCPT